VKLFYFAALDTPKCNGLGAIYWIIMQYLKQIDEKQALLESKRPFPRHTLESLREKLLVEWNTSVCGW
jgi:hypothetical protein